MRKEMPLRVSCLFLRKKLSHSAGRKEKDCLNCGAIVLGRFCQNCGQENVEPKETFWHMVTHFFYDITHFDGSFFVTVKDLLFKPGFLSMEYKRGRRKKYLHPVRMYVFTSAVFFLVFYSLYHVSENNITISDSSKMTPEKRAEIINEAFTDAKTREDSLQVYELLKNLGLNIDTAKTGKQKLYNNDTMTAGGLSITFNREVSKYQTVKEYDSVQKTLSKGEQANWLNRAITRKSIELNEKYKGDQKMLASALINKFMHSLPYLLFVSLPLYALFLKLIYIRRRNEYYFADHGVFLIHLYIFSFLLLLIYFGADKLDDKADWGGAAYLKIALIVTGLFYSIAAMKNYYLLKWAKAIVNFILLNFLSTFLLGFLFLLFLFLSFYQI